jgi:hypothetical protein
VKPELVYQVVLPVLSTGASLIAISTIAPEADNMLKQLVAAKDGRGKPVIHTINLEMVCGRCKRSGLELKCKHKLGQLPRWQTGGRHADVQALMKTQESTFLVEMRGIESNAHTRPAFDQAGVRDLCTTYYKHDGSDIRHIFVGIDPAAGGELSDYAIVSAFFTKSDQLVICGAETAKFRDNLHAVELMVNHVMSLRRNIRGANDARIVFVPESNLATEHIWGMREVRNSGLGQFCVMREDRNRVGTRTSKELKQAMAEALNQKIVRRNIFILDGFVCICDGLSTEDMLDKLMDQMKNYSRIVKPPRDQHHGNPVVSYTGKTGYGHDDMVIAIQLLNVMQIAFWTKPENYGEYY